MTENEQLWDSIGILMRQSFWGQNASITSLIANLQSEVEEFIDACKNNNTRNAWEEASDVLMILLCLLYKYYYNNNECGPNELVDRVVEKLHWRYADLYSNIVSNSEENEEKLWRDAKLIEHRLSVMFCPNENCSDYLKVDNKNIKYSDNSFICNSCGKKIIPSIKNTLFFQYKDASDLLETICKSAFSDSKGDHNVANTMFQDNPRAFRALSTQLNIPKGSLGGVDYRQILSEYIYRKFNISEQNTLGFFEKVLSIQNSINRLDNLVEQYCSLIIREQYSAKSMFPVKEWDKIREALKAPTFDVVKKVEKAIHFAARSWDNQVTQKYLLEYPHNNSENIIECMTILHYNGADIRDLTVEVSNMYNCVVGCRFCASGALPGSAKTLEPTDYVRQLNTCIKESGIDPNDFEHFFVSFAGIGEPSFTYKKVAGGMVMIKDLYPNVQFNIATFGYNIDCFSYWEGCNLPIRTIQIPLYHIDNEKLKKIVSNLPAGYHVTNVINSAISYHFNNSNCRIKLNYIPMKGINDSEKDIESFIEAFSPYRPNIIIKVSYLNYTKPAGENGFLCPGTTQLNRIVSLFREHGFNCYLFGTEINTSLGCGQLAQNCISENNIAMS